MLIKLALRNLTRSKRRTMTVLLTVAFGTSSLCLLHGFNNSTMDTYREDVIHSRFANGQINTRGYREKVYEKPWEHWLESTEELETALRATPGVTHLFPRTEFFALLSNGKVSVAGKGQGIHGEVEAEFFNRIQVQIGETLSTQPDGIILGIGLARTLDVKPGDRVTVLANTVFGSMNGLDFTVAGIFHSGQKDFDDTVFRVQLDQVKTLLDTQKVETIAIGLDRVESWKNVAETMKRFPQLEATPFEVLDEVYYQHSIDWLNAQFRVIQLIILSIVLLGIFNSVSTSVLERKQEIGNLRANGDSRREIVAMLACEGAVLGVFGAICGLVLTYFLIHSVLRNGIVMPPAPGITRTFTVYLNVRMEMAAQAMIMVSIATLFGTLLAGTRVSRMPIGEALRSV